MYCFSDDICIRNCDEIIFFVNKRTNSILTIKEKALEYLDENIKDQLTEKKLSCCNKDFIKFVKKLEENGVLVIKNED